jgi:hypothetical protein
MVCVRPFQDLDWPNLLGLVAVLESTLGTLLALFF